MIERLEKFRKEKLGSIEFLLFVYGLMGGISAAFAIMVNIGVLSI